MAVTQRFRSAFNGFNREDVVNYIEYLNNQHVAQVNQLNNQLQEAKGAVSADELADLQAQLDAALQRCAELEKQLQTKEATVSRELEAYRRAERAERIAADRVAQLYNQANGALADATAKADDTATQVTELTDALMVQLQQLQTVLSSGGNSMRDAAAALFAIRPATNEE